LPPKVPGFDRQWAQGFRLGNLTFDFILSIRFFLVW
jgi:hypothetical protein